MQQLPEAARQAIFVDLVAAQDGGASVSDSRMLVATRHSIKVEDVRQIEGEGLEKQWPPL